MRRFGCRKKYFRCLIGSLTAAALFVYAPLSAAATEDAHTLTPDGMGMYTDAPVFLSQGDRGTAVSALQDTLRSLGYDPGETDGVYTLATARAVKAFEADAGLYTDGVCSAAVLAAAEYLSGQQARQDGIPAYDREALCRALASAGCTVDGNDTQSLRDALLLFQRTNGLFGTGKADTATLCALGLLSLSETADTRSAYADLCTAVLTEALCVYAASERDADLYTLISHGTALVRRYLEKEKTGVCYLADVCTASGTKEQARTDIPLHVIRCAAEEVVRRYLMEADT